jgi:hypothetical protein
MTGNTDLHELMKGWGFDGEYKKSNVNDRNLSKLPQLVFDSCIKKKIHFEDTNSFCQPIYLELFKDGNTDGDGYILVHASNDEKSDTFICKLFDENNRYSKFKSKWHSTIEQRLPDNAKNTVNNALGKIDDLNIRTEHDAISKIHLIRQIMGDSSTHPIPIGQINQMQEYRMKERFKVTYKTLDEYLNTNRISHSLANGTNNELFYFIVPRELFDSFLMQVCEVINDLGNITVTINDENLLIFQWPSSGSLVSQHIGQRHTFGDGIRKELYQIAQWFDVYMQDASGRAMLCTEERRNNFLNKVTAHLNTSQTQSNGQVIILFQH